MAPKKAAAKTAAGDAVAAVASAPPAAAAAAAIAAAPLAPQADPNAQPSLALGAVEAFGAQLIFYLASQFVSEVVKPAVADSPHARDIVGFVRVVVLLAVFSLLYGQRFSPQMEPFAASVAAGKSILGLLTPRLDAPVVLLLLFHAAQLAFVVSPLVHPGGVPSLAAVTGCLTSSSVVWGVAWEELVYRAMLFYVVLQRSGGQVHFSVLASALVFGAIHVGNIAKSGADAPLMAVLVVAVVLFAATYSVLFAASGSLGSVMLVHAANNVVATVWAAVDPTRGGDHPACAPCFSHVLAGSVGAQAVVYLAAAALAWRAMTAALHTPRATGGNAFKALHPTVYSAGGGGGSGKAKAE